MNPIILFLVRPFVFATMSGLAGWLSFLVWGPIISGAAQLGLHITHVPSLATFIGFGVGLVANGLRLSQPAKRGALSDEEAI